MEFKKLMFAIIAVSMMVIAVGVIVDSWGDYYGSGVTSDLEELNVLDEISSTAESQKGTISPQSGEASSDFETGMFRGGYGIITSIFSPLRVVFGEDGMIDQVVERFGLPDYVYNGWVAFFIFAIIFTIIAIIFRLGRTAA